MKTINKRAHEYAVAHQNKADGVALMRAYTVGAMDEREIMKRYHIRTKVFISGKVSGIDYMEACRLFYDAAKLVLARGFEPVVPVDLCRSFWGWYRCMAVCLWHLAGCRYVLQLDNWRDSRGARWEYRAGRLLRKRFLRIEEGKIVEL